MGIGGLGVPELLIILVIVVVLFGASRLRGVGSALGGGIKEFRKSVRDETTTKTVETDDTTGTTTTTKTTKDSTTL